MNCPHFSTYGEHSMTCAIIGEGTKFMAPGSPHNPCGACQSHWVDGPPATPTDNLMLVKMANSATRLTLAFESNAMDQGARTVTTRELFARFRHALVKWKRAGLPLASWFQFRHRLKACRACEWWTGLKCRKCGCTVGKLMLATEECPLPEPEKKWKSLV